MSDKCNCPTSRFFPHRKDKCLLKLDSSNNNESRHDTPPPQAPPVVEQPPPPAVEPPHVEEVPIAPPPVQEAPVPIIPEKTIIPHEQVLESLRKMNMVSNEPEYIPDEWVVVVVDDNGAPKKVGAANYDEFSKPAPANDSAPPVETPVEPKKVEAVVVEEKAPEVVKYAEVQSIFTAKKEENDEATEEEKMLDRKCDCAASHMFPHRVGKCATRNLIRKGQDGASGAMNAAASGLVRGADYIRGSDGKDGSIEDVR